MISLTEVQAGIAYPAIDSTWANREAYDMAEQFYEASTNTLDMIESGKVDTGMIDALLYNWFGGVGQVLKPSTQAAEREECGSARWC